MVKKKRTRFLVALLLVFILHTQISPHIAFARSSGDGDLAEFDSGKFATNVGISVGSMLVGAYIGGELSSAIGMGTSTAAQNTPLIAQMANGYSTYVAASQVGSAIGSMGAYYEWSQKGTYIAQTIGTAATAGFLNPEISLGNAYDNMVTESIAQGGASTLAYNLPTMLKGAAVGALGGAASGYAVAEIDGHRINDGKNPGIGAQMAGMVAGMAATSLGRSLFDPTTWNHQTKVYVEQVPNQGEALDRLANQNPGNNPLEGEGLLVANETTGVVSRQPSVLLEVRDGFREVGSGEELYLTVDKISADGQVTYGETIYDGKIFTGQETQVTFGETAYDGIFSGQEANEVTVHNGNIMDLSHPKDYNEALPRFRGYSRGSDIFKIVDTQAQASIGAGEIVGRLAKATFVDTVHQYPAVAASYVGMVVTNELGKDDQDEWRPLINGLSHAVVGTALTNLRDFSGLTPALYVGSDSDIMDARLMRKETLNSYGYQQRMSESFNKKASGYANDADKAIGAIEEARRNNLIDEKVFSAARVDILKELEKNLASLSHVEKNKDFNLGEIDGSAKSVLDSLAGTSDEKYFSLDDKNKWVDLSATVAHESTTIPQLMRNVAIMKEGKRLEYNMAHANDTNVALKDVAKVDRGKLFLSRTGNGIRFGVFNSLIGDGMAVVFNKNDGDSTKQILGSWAANMGAAVARGMAWHYGWREAETDWHQRWDYVEPRSYEDTYANQFWEDPETRTTPIENFWEQEGYNPISHMVSRTNYYDDRIRWDRFAGSTGVSPLLHREHKKFDFAKGEKGEYVSDPRWVTILVFPDERPELGDAIRISINQANTEFAANAFSFGRPLVKHDRRSITPGLSPSQVSPSTFLNYVSQLKYASGLSLDAAIANSVVDANVGAIGNSIMSIASQSPALCKIFKIQPQRLVKVAALEEVSTPYRRVTLKHDTPLGGPFNPEASERIEILEFLSPDGEWLLAKRNNSFSLKGDGTVAGNDNSLVQLRFSGFDSGNFNMSDEESFAELHSGEYMGEAGTETTRTWKGKVPAYLAGVFAGDVPSVYDSQDILSYNLGYQAVAPVNVSIEEGVRFTHVLDRNVSGMPYTVQSLEYRGGTASTHTTFYAPFPNALFSAQPQIGPGDYLRKSIVPTQSVVENLEINE